MRRKMLPRYYLEYSFTNISHPLLAQSFLFHAPARLIALDWADTRIELPDDAPTHWTNRLPGTPVDGRAGISVPTVLNQLPVALLRSA